MNLAYYLIQVNIYLVLFYAFYQLLLTKETFFNINRLYLVSSALVSILIPVLQMQWVKNLFITQKVQASNVTFSLMINAVEVTPIVKDTFTLGDAIASIYLIGLIASAIIFIIRLIALFKQFNRKQTGAAFSFFNKKKVDPNLPKADVILYHELVHAKHLHSVDVVFFELLRIAFWFNPIVYLYQKSIKNIHEFIADEEAAEYQGDKAEYAMLIVSKTLGINPQVLANQFFNQSILKRRIFMLHKEKSKKIAALKYGIAVPLFAAMVVFSSAKIEKNNTLKKAAETVELSAPIETINEKLVKPIQISISKKLTDTVKKKTPKTIKDIQLIGEPLNNKKPLYVIDGKESTQEAFKLLKPDDIASIEVIKDANATSLYGEKAKDGAILINTKIGENKSLESHNHKDDLVVIDGVIQQEKGFKAINTFLSSGHEYKTMSNVFLHGKDAIAKYGDKGKDGVIEITTKAKTVTISGKDSQGQPTGDVTKLLQGKVIGLNNKSTTISSKDTPANVYILLDEKPITWTEVDKLDPNKISSIEILKDKAATVLYGDKGKDGAILITTKKVKITPSKKEETKVN